MVLDQRRKILAVLAVVSSLCRSSSYVHRLSARALIQTHDQAESSQLFQTALIALFFAKRPSDCCRPAQSQQSIAPLSGIAVMATSPTGEDQGRLLEEALAIVRQQSLQMRKCLENPGKLMDALKCG